MTAYAYELADGRRGVVAWLPIPKADKNARLGWSRGGRRFLTPDARADRALLAEVVVPVLPARPWVRAPYAVHVLTFLGAEHSADVDHYVSGSALDDLMRAKATEDDAGCVFVSAGLYRADPDSGLLLIAEEAAPDTYEVRTA